MKSTDLILDQTIVESFRQWMRAAGRHDVALINGESTGCGITTMIRLVCAEESVDHVIIESSIVQARTFLKSATQCPVTTLGFKKILVIDPVDAVLYEPSCALDIIDFLKSGTCGIPIVVAGHVLRSSISKITDALKTTSSIVNIFQFPKLDSCKALIALTFYKILIGSSAHVMSVWTGDFRNAMHAIRMDLGSGTVKDMFCDGLDALQKLLCDPSITFQEALRLHANDMSMLTAGVHENYPMVPKQTIENCAALAECFSAGDVFDTEMYAHQKWELSGVQAACTAGAVAVLSTKQQNTEKTHHPPITKFGTLWSRGNNQRSKWKKNVSLLKQTLPSLIVEDFGYIRTILHTDIDAAARFVQTYGADSLLAVMRLWKTKYSMSMHQKNVLHARKQFD